MRVLIFGATGMVGQGVLREGLAAQDVEAVMAVGRSATGTAHPKLHDLIASDLFDVATYESQLTGFDACFFCLGVTSAGMTEEAYTRLTFTLTTAIADKLAQLNPAMTLVYVSGSGTDSTEKGRSMWARVKGRTENTLLRMPFRAAYMLRPGFIVPLDGIKSKTRSYRILYSAFSLILPLLHSAFPKWILTTRELGEAMLILARSEAPKQVLEAADIRDLLNTKNPRK